MESQSSNLWQVACQIDFYSICYDVHWHLKLSFTDTNFVDSGVKISSSYYQDMLLSQQLLPMMCDVSDDFFIFQQDMQRTCTLGTRHCYLLSSQHPSFLQICGCQIAPTLIGRLQDVGWHQAASASVAAAQHWRTEEAFARRLARHGPQHHWWCNWRVA